MAGHSRGIPPLSRLNDQENLSTFAQTINSKEAFILVLNLLDKYPDIPMSIADACLVRLTEILPDPLLLTTASYFKIYRLLGRRVIPTRMP